MANNIYRTYLQFDEVHSPLSIDRDRNFHVFPSILETDKVRIIDNIEFIIHRRIEKDRIDRIRTIKFVKFKMALAYSEAK